MSAALHLATLNLLRWLEAAPRADAETMEAWRSSCPRLSVWEDALLEGLVEIAPGAGGMAGAQVRLTGLGVSRLRAG
jgi:hypothetical protein